MTHFYLGALKELSVPLKTDNFSTTSDDAWKIIARLYTIGSEGTLLSASNSKEFEVNRLDIFRDDNIRLLLESMAISGHWDWDFAYMQSMAKNSGFDHFPLIWKLIHENGSLSGLDYTKDYFQDMISSAPCEGPHASLDLPRNPNNLDQWGNPGTYKDWEGQPIWNAQNWPYEWWNWPRADGWAANNRWVIASHAETGSPHWNQRGEYAGLDYLLIHNLYHLMWEEEIDTKYERVISCECVEDITEILDDEFVLPEGETTYEQVAEQYTLRPHFPDYNDKKIPLQRFLTHDLEVKESKELRLESDLTICNESTLRITEGSTLVVQEGRQITIKSGSELIIEDGAELIFEDVDDPEGASRALIMEDNTALRFLSADYTAQGDRRLVAGNNCAIQFIDCNVSMLGGQTSTGSGHYDLWDIGDNCTLTTEQCNIDLPSEARIHIGDDLVWESDDFNFNVGVDNGNLHIPARLSIGARAEIDFETSLHIQNANIIVDNEGDVDIKDCDITVYSAPGTSPEHRALLSTDRFTDVHWNGGTALHLNGNEAVFEFGGVVKIYDGATFSFDWEGQESGHVKVMDGGWSDYHFEPMSGGESIVLQGNGPDDLILDTGDFTDFEFKSQNEGAPDTERIRISDGTVLFGENSRITVHSELCEMERVNFIGDCRGILVFYNNEFKDCNFRGQGNGIRARFYSSSKSLDVSDCSFEDGAFIDNYWGSIKVLNSHFTGTAWDYIYTTGLDRPSVIKGCNFADPEHAAINDDGSLVKLSVTNCDFSNDDAATQSQYAIRKSGGQLRLRCNDIDGYDLGVSLGEGASLEMGNMTAAGYNVFDGNEVDVHLAYHQKGYQTESKIDLRYGYNTFLTSGATSHHILGSIGEDAGVFQTVNPPVNLWPIKGNYWEETLASEDVIPGVHPYFGIPMPDPARFGICEYGAWFGPQVGYSCDSDEIYPIEYDIQEPFVRCGTQDQQIAIDKSLSGGDDKLTYTGESYAKSNIDSLIIDPVLYTLTFDSILTSDAVRYTSGLMELYNDSTGDNMLALQLFKEVLLYDYDSLAIHAEASLDIAYSEMKTCLEHSFSQGQIYAEDNTVSFHPKVQDFVDVLMHRTADDVDSLNYVEQFFLEIDKAHFFNMLGRHELGYQLLLNLDNCPLDSTEQAQLNNIIYTAQLHLLMNQSGLGTVIDSVVADVDTSSFVTPTPLEAVEFYFGAQILGVDQVTYTNCDYVDWKELGTPGKRDFFVYPNPTSGILTIAYEHQKDEELYFELTDFQGRQLSQHRMHPKQGLVQIDISHLPDASYLYTIRNQRKVLESGQVVKQR